MDSAVLEIYAAETVEESAEKRDYEVVNLDRILAPQAKLMDLTAPPLQD